MIYIRTNEGRIRVVVEPSDFEEEERRKIPDNCTMVMANNIFGCSIVENENIIKQADTIEELCDEFVIVGISGIPYGTHGLLGECEKREKNFLKQLIKTQEYEIYGAIWTDKGLIYVAKMNDKGELELL